MWFSCKPFIYIKTGDIFDTFVYVFNFHGRVEMMPQCTCARIWSHRLLFMACPMEILAWVSLAYPWWLSKYMYICKLLANRTQYLLKMTFINPVPEKNPYVTIFNIPLYSLLLFIAALYFFPAICLALQILELYN